MKKHKKKEKINLDSRIEINGVVSQCLSNGFFKITTIPYDFVVLGHLAGKMRRNSIKVRLGDYVRIELSAYDYNRGRIVYRYASKPKLTEDTNKVIKDKKNK